MTSRTPPLPDRSRSPRLDGSLDETIVAAAAELLAEVGYDAMSMDAVATRAGVGKATIYRRWSGKAPLVLDTVRSRGFPIEEAPETGTLRGDLLALFLALCVRLDEQSLNHLTGVLVAMRDHPELGEAVKEQVVVSWARATREIVERAVARDEIAAQPEDFLDLFAKTGPSIVALRFFMADGPIDADFMAQIVDQILLPILQQR
jgi:AcrR family transcriptional regulator